LSATVVIPARLGSTRLPGKVLADIGGRPMVVRVWEQASRSRGVDEVLVATDDESIFQAVEKAGGRAVMTRGDHPSGTDRIAEVAAGLDSEVIVNVQGDLPLLDPGWVEMAIRALEEAPLCGGQRAVMSTLATSLGAGEEDRPQVVKVVCDQAGHALYFSRKAIPAGDAACLKHIGLYAYRRDFLLKFAQLRPTPLERSEKLEQLRVLEYGEKIRVVMVELVAPMVEVDTQEDLDRIRALVEAGDAAGGS
jgi:3-deoxy-manno-octulosonate cytidylyltransferase (CMP-KDO synthetase)